MERQRLYQEIGALTSHYATVELAADFMAATIPHAIINTIAQVADLDALKDKLTTTTIPGGRKIHMQPAAVDDGQSPKELDFPPRYGEQTRLVLKEAGYTDADCNKLAEDGIIFTAA